MLTPEQILKIAQDLKSSLPKYLPADRAEAVNRELTRLLTQQAADKNVAQQIFDLLDGQPELAPLLSNSASKGVTPPPGDNAPPPASQPTPFKGIPEDKP
jgi:hypothetical protein